MNGVGEKRMIIEENANHECITEALEKAFPKLKTPNGAFQLMRYLSGGSGVRPFFSIISGP